MGAHFPGECLETCEDGLLLILAEDQGLAPGKPLDEFLSIVRQHIEKFVRLSCTCMISGNPCTLDEIKKTYASLLSLSYYRILSGKGTDIHAGEVVHHPIEEFVYPMESVSALAQNIVNANEQEAYANIHEILRYAAMFGATVLNSCISSLLITLNNVFSSIKKSNHLALDYSFDLYIEQIQSFETLDEIESFFRDRFSAIIADLAKNKSSRRERLVSQAAAYIQENFHKPDLGLMTIADHAGISASYLSKIFKQNMTVSLNDYISSVRMEKACSLLQNTSLSVGEVMKKTGFISRSHFYTLFKNTYGVTPVEMKHAPKSLIP